MKYPWKIFIGLNLDVYKERMMLRVLIGECEENLIQNIQNCYPAKKEANDYKIVNFEF